MPFGLIESKRADSKTIEQLNWTELSATHFSFDFEKYQMKDAAILGCEWPVTSNGSFFIGGLI